MSRKLVPFNGRQYLAVNKVALERAALALQEVIDNNINIESEDPYEIKSKLLPAIRKAIAHEIELPYSDKVELIGGQFLYEYREGILPDYFSREFKSTFSTFAVEALSLPRKIPQIEYVDGVQMAWFELQ